MKVSQITLQWAGLKVQNGSKNLAIVHEQWCQKENVNKEHRQMKNNNNNKMKINIAKTSGGYPKQVPSLGVFDYFMVILIIYDLWLFYDYLWVFYNYFWLFVVIKWLFVIALLWHVSIVCINVVGGFFWLIDDYYNY